MPPALLILGVGDCGRVLIPFPLFLLWPLIGLAWLALTLCQPFVWTSKDAREWLAMGKRALFIFGHLSGLRIDVQSKNGSGVHIQII